MDSSTYHTKTSLKKVKKDELVEMLLTSQAKSINDKMENDVLKERFDRLSEHKIATEMEIVEKGTKDCVERIEELTEEIEECQACLTASDTALGIIKEENEVNKKNMFRFMEENEKLRKEYFELKVKGMTEILKEMPKSVVEKLKKENEELEQFALTAISLNCDCCQSSLTEDDVVLSLDYGKFICESCSENEELKRGRKDAKTFVGILGDSCDGVWHFLGQNCDELTAKEIIDTELMESKDFACFNDDWESQH